MPCSRDTIFHMDALVVLLRSALHRWETSPRSLTYERCRVMNLAVLRVRREWILGRMEEARRVACTIHPAHVRRCFPCSKDERKRALTALATMKHALVV